MQPSSKSGDEFSVYVRNLDPSTSPAELEELLYELFLQAGPLSRVHLPYDRSTGAHRGYGFVEFMHKESIPYAIGLLEGIKILGRPLTIRPAGTQNNAVTPLIPGGGTGMRNGDSPCAATPGNSFQQALDHSHPMHARHRSMSSPFPPADLRSPSVDLVPPHHYSPMESPRGCPSMELPRGYPPIESVHGYPPMEPPYHFSPTNPNHYALLPPPPFSLPPPLLPPLSPMELERSHHRHHESRLHSRDHPHWLKEDVRDRLSRYHQHELERQSHSRRSSHESESHRRSSHEESHRRSSQEEPHRRSSHEESHRRSSHEESHQWSSHEESHQHYH